MDESEIQKLLRLKRYEQPDPRYFDSFLAEFRRRQRAEILRRPLWRIALDRLESFFAETSVPKFAYAAGAAGIGFSVGIFSRHNSPPPGNPALADTRSPRALSVDVAQRKAVDLGSPLELRGATQQAASRPRYVLDSQPVSYELPVSF